MKRTLLSSDFRPYVSGLKIMKPAIAPTIGAKEFDITLIATYALALAGFVNLAIALFI